MKFYKVIKENFLWEVGAILKMKFGDSGYVPIDDIFRIHEDSDEYISTNIIENSPKFFERVYKINLISSVVYKIKEEAKKMIQKGI